MDFLHSRRAELLRANTGEAHLVFHRPNVAYLTGLADADATLVSSKGTFALLAEPLLKRAKNKAADITVVPRAADKSVFEGASEMLAQAGVKAAAVEAERLSVAALGRLQALTKATLTPHPDRVEYLREVKDPSEVESLRIAGRLAQRGLAMLLAIMRETDHEVELCRQLDALLYRAGADEVPAPSLVLVGDSSGDAAPHPSADKPIGDVSKGYALAAARKGGYCGVIDRTFRSPFGSPPLLRTRAERMSHKFPAVQAAIKEATQAAVAALVPDATIDRVAAVAHKALAAHNLGKFAAQEVGYGVGLDPREGPTLRAGGKGKILAGMVLMVAPRVVIPDWGAMAEGVVVVVGASGSNPLVTPLPPAEE